MRLTTVVCMCLCGIQVALQWHEMTWRRCCCICSQCFVTRCTCVPDVGSVMVTWHDLICWWQLTVMPAAKLQGISQQLCHVAILCTMLSVLCCVYLCCVCIYVMQSNPPSVPVITETEVYDRVASSVLAVYLCFPGVSMLYVYLCCAGQPAVSTSNDRDWGLWQSSEAVSGSTWSTCWVWTVSTRRRRRSDVVTCCHGLCQSDSVHCSTVYILHTHIPSANGWLLCG